MEHDTQDILEYAVLENIRSHLDSMHNAERKVAAFILNNPNLALESNVSETAERSGVSDATVVRFCQRLGYSGFFQMKLRLSHDIAQDRILQINNGEQKPNSAREKISLIANTILSISQRVSTDTFRRCADAINRSPTVIVVGNGHAKILASDIIYRLTRLGIRCSGGGYAETDFENIHLGQRGEVAIFVSHSGEDRKTVEEMRLATKSGLTTIAITDASKCPMAQYANYSLSTGVPSGNRMVENYTASHLYMMVLVETLFQYVEQRHKDFDYLDVILSTDRL